MAPGIIRHCVLHDTSCYTMRFYYSRPTRFCCQISSGAPGQATSGVRLDTRTLKFRKYLTILVHALTCTIERVLMGVPSYQLTTN